MDTQLRKYISLFASGLLAGLVAGGFIWGSQKPQEQHAQTATVERTVEVEKTVTVTVERTVLVKESFKADKVVKETVTKPNGEVTIREEAYNLGVQREEQEKYSLQLNQSEKSVLKAKEASETSSVYLPIPQKHHLWVGTYLNPLSPLSYDYKTDWLVGYSHKLWDSPFSLGVFGGPKLIGLTVGGAF
jgi:hypothetical protein